MPSMIASSVILLLSWGLMAQCGSEDLSTNYTNLLTFLNGDFDNYDNSAGGEDMDRIRLIFKPVSIPGLQEDPVLFGEESVNENVLRRWVALRNERSTDRVLYANYYNFTSHGHYEPGTFNIDDLANLTQEDLYGGCPGFFQRVTAQLLMAEWSDCRHTVNGKYPVYGCTFTCNDLIFESPLASDEASNLTPYHLKQRGPRNPLIGAPEGYVNPCQDGQ